jgi:predicted kinase
MDKPFQYLLVGFPYSGKTTLAKELVKKFGFVHINLDQLKWDMGYTNVGDDEVPDEIWEKILIKANELLVKYLNEGKNVANEYAWITREWRDKARKVAREAGFETRVVYIKLPGEEIRKRWLENSKTRQRFHWPEEEFERMFTDFEEPSSDENIVYYDGSVPIENWAEKHLLLGDQSIKRI